MKHLITFFMIVGFSFSCFAKEFTFYVKMACGNCSQAIGKQIKKDHKGKYTDLHADFEKNVVTLESDSLTDKQIIASIEKAGFTVSDTPIQK